MSQYNHRYGKPLPESYPTMYLDGYTPEEILRATHDKIIKRYLETRDAKDEISEIKITSDVRLKK